MQTISSIGDEVNSLHKNYRDLSLFSNQLTLPFSLSSSSPAKMATAVELFPSEYGYVVIALLLYCLLDFWMSFQVGNARKKYNVQYPNLYAVESDNKDAKRFNCVQRGHQNCLEYMPIFFSLLLIGGIQHPRIAAALGLAYTVLRFFYFKGYSSGIPKNRLTIGGYNFFALSGLILCAASFGIHLILRDLKI